MKIAKEKERKKENFKENQSGMVKSRWLLEAVSADFNWRCILRVRLEGRRKKRVFNLIYMKMRRRGKSGVLKFLS